MKHYLFVVAVFVATSLVATELTCPSTPTSQLFSVNPTKPYQCADYFKCVDGKVVLQRCTGNKHFNSVKQKCDSPINAGCVTGFS